VFHKIITTGHQRLQPLFDCLITIIDNVSPYVKSLSMVSASKLLHLTEAFSQPWFLYSAPNNYQLVLFLLEVFNNIIQYQFDGNSCLVYSIIRKRQVFYQLANLPSTDEDIREILSKHGGLRRRFEVPSETEEDDPEEEVVEEELEVDQEEEKAPNKTTEDKEVVEEEVIEKKHKEGVEGMNGDSTKASSKEVGSKSDGTAEADDANELSNLQTSLVGTPSLASMTTGTAPVGSSADAAERVSGDDLHSHEGPFSPVHIAFPSSSSTDVPGSRQLEETFAVTHSPDFIIEKVKYSLTRKLFGIKLHTYFPYLQRRKVETNKASSLKSEEGTTTSTAVITESSKPSKKSQPRRMTATSAAASSTTTTTMPWRPTARWVAEWREMLPLQTIMRMLQVLVPQVEKICIEKSLKDEPQILKFLQNGTLVGLLPVPHPILIRKYQSNVCTTVWFRTYIWGVIYLRNSDPPIWFDTNVRLFEVQRS
ncbi:unnamed protein product, partial [Rodentolepis nana]|uniref:Protein HID1 n=1 Tax=Rodentolepis nana TaxID=102285 RepID=A0A0R3TTV2_RODNA